MITVHTQQTCFPSLAISLSPKLPNTRLRRPTPTLTLRHHLDRYPISRLSSSNPHTQTSTLTSFLLGLTPTVLLLLGGPTHTHTSTLTSSLLGPTPTFLLLLGGPTHTHGQHQQFQFGVEFCSSQPLAPTAAIVVVLNNDKSYSEVKSVPVSKGGQYQQYVHIEDYQKVLATLREHEDKIREQKERMLALETDFAILKDGPPRHRSHNAPVNEYGGCSTLGGQDVSHVHETPLADMYADVGGVGSSHVQIGVEIPISPRMEADDGNVDHPALAVGALNEAQVEAQTGGDNAEGALEGGSNIATRVKGNHRMWKQSSKLDPPYTRSYMRKNKKTTDE